jgi:putative transposase
VARYHERVRCQRSDFLHKFTTGLVEHFGTVCVEDLGLPGLCQTHLAKSFHDAGIGEAIRQLEYKQAWRGGVLQKVGRFFPSTKRCHVCGLVNAALTLADRTWRCDGCGTVHDRDLNAALNIELEGLALLAGSGYVGVTPVELVAPTGGVRTSSTLRAVKQERTGVAHVCTPER